MGRIVLPITAVLVAAFMLTQPADAEEHQGHLGKVHFPTSCTSEAQTTFDRAMLYQHSFWYSAARRGFEEVLKIDPACVIAYWGIAQSLLANPFNPTPPRNFAEARAAIAKARAIGAKTQRENDFIATIAAFYADDDSLDGRARAESYAKAMENLAGKYAEDNEAQIYYALALNMAASPNDKTYANQLKAASILEPIFRSQPSHPGAAHYLIHTYDYPPIADKGLEAAKRYAAIAEAAPHAQHMPSHIFTRVGYWKESVASNEAAARIAKANNEPDDQLHASDYMVYAFLQMGQDDKARQIVEEMKSVEGFSADRNTAPFALAASPARYMLERGDWKGAAELKVRASKLPYVEAITYFARALGAARSGNPQLASADIARLFDLRDKLREAKNDYWADQVDIQAQGAAAWVLQAERRYAEAVKTMTVAAEAEERTDKATVTPGPLVPARELLGQMLLAQGAPTEALAAFETTLKKEPNRLGAASGAAKAAEKAGDFAKARQYYAKVIELSGGSPTSRAEIVEAVSFMSRR